MKCPNCGYPVDDNWKYCPKCGTKISGDLFENIFSRFRKEFQEMNKLFEQDFEAFDLSPVFRNQKGSGFSIKITSDGGRPKVSVKTFGDVDKNKINEELRRLGVESGVKEIKKSESKRPLLFHRQREKPKAVPKITEEPKTEVRRVNNKVLVEMEIPGVKSMKDVLVRELENSVEVKATAGEKAYFKIITKPPQSRLIDQKFENEKLFLEFG